MVKKVKKVNKYRGSVSHGGGSRKKRRGAGSRGGRGRAGTGKRAGHKKEKLGSKGFIPRRSTVTGVAVNVAFFTESKLAELSKAGTVTQEGDLYVIDLKKLGFVKVLGTGNLLTKLKLKGSCSAKATEKITAAGGTVE
jgi:large subunit ribosomal protein L15